MVPCVGFPWVLGALSRTSPQAGQTISTRSSSKMLMPVWHSSQGVGVVWYAPLNSLWIFDIWSWPAVFMGIGCVSGVYKGVTLF